VMKRTNQLVRKAARKRCPLGLIPERYQVSHQPNIIQDFLPFYFGFGEKLVRTLMAHELSTKIALLVNAASVFAMSGVGFVQQSSKSPQSSSICNHTLARGDLLDSRLSVRTVYVLSSPPTTRASV